MAPAAAFAEVLDACVGGFESGEPAAARRRHSGIATTAMFAVPLDVARRASTRPAVDAPLRLVHSAPEHLIAAGPARPAARPARPRPTRRMTARQHGALDQLNAFGAGLGVDFTAEELRSAFRSLARAFHPDHYPGAGASEKAILSVKFATVRGAYDVLRPINNNGSH